MTHVSAQAIHDEFEGKMLGLVGVSGGGMGAFGAMDSLREVGRALHAWVIPEQAAIPEAWKVFDESGILKDRDLEKRVKEVGRQVARFAYLLYLPNSRSLVINS